MTNINQYALSLDDIEQFLGVDRLLKDFELMTLKQNVQDKYPPHNIVKKSDTEFVVELAVAGFSKEELSVVIEDKLLKISGGKDPDSREYIHKGISTKSFQKNIPIIDTVEVRGAGYDDGILRIYLENVIPEHKKPKTIPIDGIHFF